MNLGDLLSNLAVSITSLLFPSGEFIIINMVALPVCARLCELCPPLAWMFVEGSDFSILDRPGSKTELKTEAAHMFLLR